jgi:hypothetical protein
MFSEDLIPPCRSTAHPAHQDRRKYMFVAKEDAEHVVWCCRRCTEIVGSPAIQVRVLPRGRERAHQLRRQPYVRPTV